MGRCDACGAWNTIVEELPVESGPRPAAKGRKIGFEPLKGESQPAARRTTAIGEFDRVCGGGLVVGSAVLVGGDPGIGKSTLLLQAVAALATAHGPEGGARVAYISGEEAIDQVRLRAQRLGVIERPVALAAATNVGD